jgi:hypothetical protein
VRLLSPAESGCDEVTDLDLIEIEGVPAWQRWLQRPQSGLVCLSAWVLASAIFIGMVALLGGPSQSDAAESLYATWAIAHGSFACAYPPVSSHSSHFFLYYVPGPSVPPFWPLVSGGAAAVVGIGHTAPFPSSQALGAHCANAYPQMYHWAQNTAAIFPTIGLGYLSWFFLLAGVVAVLRAAGRGRSGWEVVGVLVVAAVPVVWEPLLVLDHPQDLAALGLALIATACALRRQWVWAGMVLGLAVASQQFALLVLAPLFVIAPGRARWKLLGPSAAVVVALSAPFIFASSGRALHSVLFGTGDSLTDGGTILWESGIRGAGLVFSARVLPILAGMGLAWWAYRRLGTSVLQPLPLISLLATTLSLRVVFEEGLFGYKFMALAVMLIVLAVVHGWIRGRLIAWLALASLLFNPIPAGLAINARPWGGKAAALLPLVCIAVVLVLVAYDAVHRRVRWYLVVWLVVAIFATGQWPPLTLDSIRSQLPLWLLQLILLPTGIVMAVGPLVTSIWHSEAKTLVNPEGVGS